MRKKIVILIGLLLTTSIFANGFRGVKWGENFSSIKKIEQGKNLTKSEKTETYKKYEWNEEVYNLKDTLKSAGTFDIDYILLKDKLIRGSYTQEIKNENLDNYNKIKKILINKYGESQNKYSSSFYENNGKKEVKQNQEILDWYNENTKIELSLINKDKFTITYYTLDKDLNSFIREVGLEKQKAKEKELLKDSDYIGKFL